MMAIATTVTTVNHRRPLQILVSPMCMILHKHDASRDDWLQMSSEIDRISRVCEYFRVSTHFQGNCLPHVDYKKKMIDGRLLYDCEMHNGRKPDSNCEERIEKHMEEGMDWGKWWVTLGGFQELGAWGFSWHGCTYCRNFSTWHTDRFCSWCYNCLWSVANVRTYDYGKHSKNFTYSNVFKIFHEYEASFVK